MFGKGGGSGGWGGIVERKMAQMGTASSKNCTFTSRQYDNTLGLQFCQKYCTSHIWERLEENRGNLGSGWLEDNAEWILWKICSRLYAKPEPNPLFWSQPTKKANFYSLHIGSVLHLQCQVFACYTLCKQNLWSIIFILWLTVCQPKITHSNLQNLLINN